MSTLADNFFSCREIPANFPSGLKLNIVNESPTSILRIISQIPGPGNYTGPIDFFFDINENPTTSIHFNGHMYNLSKSYLCMPGIHKIVGETKVCNAEIVIVFNPSQSTSSKQLPIMFCVPVESGIRINPKSQKYFATLGTGVTPNRPTLGSILPPNPKFVTYNGFNFMLRLNTNDTLKKCSDIPAAQTNNVRYMVCQNSIGMAVSDYNRLNGQLARKPRPVNANDYAPLEQLLLPPKSTDEISSARYTQITTLITNVKIEAADALATAVVKNSKGVPIRDMKCKPLRTGGSKLRVDMTKGGKTLDKELAKTQEDLNNMDLEQIDPGITPSTPSNMQPGDVERGLSIFFGILLGMVIFAAVVFFVQWLVYGKSYLDIMDLLTKQKGSASKITSSLPVLPHIGFPDIPKMLCPKE
jgi:hypothetical protein